MKVIERFKKVTKDRRMYGRNYRSRRYTSHQQYTKDGKKEVKNNIRIEDEVEHDKLENYFENHVKHPDVSDVSEVIGEKGEETKINELSFSRSPKPVWYGEERIGKGYIGKNWRGEDQFVVKCVLQTKVDTNNLLEGKIMERSRFK
jgi:hypothetical protein